MIKHSFHNHTYLCNHATGTVDDYVQEALKSGLTSFGVSDHIPFPDRRWSGSRMDTLELDDYTASVLRARNSYSSIEVFLGAECEWVAEYSDLYDRLLDEKGFHYLIGGAHFIPMKDGSWPGFTKLKSKTDLKSFSSHVIDLIESGYFLFLAHPDVFLAGYRRWDAESRACALDIIRCAREHQFPLELNANGMRKPRIVDWDGTYRFQYPVRQFWELVAEEYGEALVGSDAHRPEDVTESSETCFQWMDELNLKDVQERLYKKVRSRALSLESPRFRQAESLHTGSL